MDALKGQIGSLCLADEYVDETGYADGDGVDNGSDFNVFSPNTFSPNASSPLSDFSGTIEDGNAMGDLDSIPGYYTSQDSYNSSLPPNAAVIEPNPDTTVYVHDTEFSMATLTPLTNSRAVDQDAEAIDNFIFPSFWNDIHWDAFVDTETSTPTDDIDIILRNGTSLDAQRLVQIPDTLQLDHTLLNQNAECDTFLTTAPNENTSVIGGSSTTPQHPISASDTTHLHNTSANWEPEWDLVDTNTLTRSHTTPNEYASVSAVPEHYYLSSSNANANASAIGHYHAIAQDLSTLPNEYGNPADYSRGGNSFDREGNAACDFNNWTPINLYPPDLHTPHPTYQAYNVDYTLSYPNISLSTYHSPTSPS